MKSFADAVGDRTRAAKGDAAFEHAVALGRRLTVDEALTQMRQYVAEER